MVLIEAVAPSSQTEMIDFLKNHENISLFLLGNFETYGPTLTDEPYSGNFKLIRSNGKIQAVFCLTKQGTLLIVADYDHSIFECVLKACEKESIPIKGLIGNWELCHPFWKYLKDKKVIQKETLNEKDILYALDVKKKSFERSHNVRLLTEEDFAKWYPMRLDYIEELGFPNQLNEKELFDFFQSKVKNQIVWGYFLKNILTSIGDLNAKVKGDLGQVGGIYTLPTYRQKGYSKALMHTLICDVQTIHHIRKLIIFTGEHNFPARKLYEALGAEHVGYFALFFGE